MATFDPFGYNFKESKPVAQPTLDKSKGAETLKSVTNWFSNLFSGSSSSSNNFFTQPPKTQTSTQQMSTTQTPFGPVLNPFGGTTGIPSLNFSVPQYSNTKPTTPAKPDLVPNTLQPFSSSAPKTPPKVNELGSSAPSASNPNVPQIPQEQPAAKVITQADSFVAGVTTTTDDLMKKFNELYAATTPSELTNARNERTGLLSKLDEANKATAGKNERQLQLEQELGATKENMQKVNQLNTQIANLTSKYAAEQDALSRGGTTSNVTSGNVAESKRQQALDIGVLDIQRSALLGNIQYAQQQAAHLVDMEFAPKEAEIARIKEYLDLNKDTLTDAEKKQATALNFVYQQQQEQTAKAKEERTQNYNLMIDVLKAGGKSDVVDFNKTPQENLKNVGGLLAKSSDTKKETSVLNIGGRYKVVAYDANGNINTYDVGEAGEDSVGVAKVKAIQFIAGLPSSEADVESGKQYTLPTRDEVENIVRKIGADPEDPAVKSALDSKQYYSSFRLFSSNTFTGTAPISKKTPEKK